MQLGRKEEISYRVEKEDQIDLTFRNQRSPII